MTNIEQLAHRFSENLRDCLTAEEMAKVIQDNIEETNKDVCHSHDYIDANMEMQDAFESLGIGLPADPDESRFELWNQAWDMAKANHFYCASVKR